MNVTSEQQQVSWVVYRSRVHMMLLHDAIHRLAVQEWNMTSMYARSNVNCAQGWQYAGRALQVNASKCPTATICHPRQLHNCPQSNYNSAQI